MVKISYLDAKKLVLLKNENAAVYTHPLNRELAVRYASALADIHNLITHVEPWTPKEIVADEIQGRKFPGKWENSYLYLTEDLERIVGIGIGYERQAEPPEYQHNCIYLHRGALATNFQNKGLGVAFFGHDICRALQRAKICAEFIGTAEFPVMIQTKNAPSNSKVIRIHEKLGARKVGTKKYAHKEDLIFGYNSENFESSDLYLRFIEMLKWESKSA